MSDSMELAVLGGGCFWCLEAAFARVRGVQGVESGYAGGRGADPSYEAVCTGTTGHAEVVTIAFDPQLIDYGEVLELFFALHDPTTLNRQGADVGTQYRSAIFPRSDAQRTAAEKAIAAVDASGEWTDPVVTTIEHADSVYPAGDYHRDYFSRNPQNGYCQVVVGP